MQKPRVKLPDSATVGEVIEIKTIISHNMETGQRKDLDGKIIPRNIINKFVAAFNGKPVFTANLGTGISANPYIAFTMKVPGPGVFEFTWTEDGGASTTEKQTLNVA